MKQERQPKKWIENIKKDMDARNIHFDEAVATVHDRVKWRRLLAASSSFFDERDRKNNKKRDFGGGFTLAL